jgi:hypothetical protein
MISAIVLTPDTWTGDDLARERETAVRSLVWLVSAVVSSVVRDVTLAVPQGLGLAELADQSGCALVQADTEAERLSQAARVAREPRVLVIKAGFQPDAGLAEEIDIFERRAPEGAIAFLLGQPTTFAERLFPNRSAVVGALLPRAQVPGGSGFGPLSRLARRQGTPLQARARSIF